MTTNLKPCPRCQGVAHEDYSVIDGSEWKHIECPCGMRTVCCDSYQDATNLWNHRPTAWRNYREHLPPIDRPVICRTFGDTRVRTIRFRDDEPNVAFNDWQWMEVPE